MATAGVKLLTCDAKELPRVTLRNLETEVKPIALLCERKCLWLPSHPNYHRGGMPGRCSVGNCRLVRWPTVFWRVERLRTCDSGCRISRARFTPCVSSIPIYSSQRLVSNFSAIFVFSFFTLALFRERLTHYLEGRIEEKLRLVKKSVTVSVSREENVA